MGSATSDRNLQSKSAMKGKTVVITGGSSGIGAAAARALREKGATVAITGRSDETKRVADEIGADAFLVDFASFSDVRRFADELLTRYPRIDVLANNVGGVVATRRVTVDGNEQTLQVNHLSGFLLTQLLRQRLESSRATIINTSSGAHRIGRLDFSDLQSERKYSAARAYGSAKLMNILHAAEINRRFKDVHAASFHPGVVATGFAREGSGLVRLLYSDFLAKIFMLTPQQGADTLVWLTTSPPANVWQPGGFYVKRKKTKTTLAAADSVLAARLWDASEALTSTR